MKTVCDVKIHINPEFEKVLEAELEEAMRLTMEDLRDDLLKRQIMPKDNGNMERDTFSVVECTPSLIKGFLITDTPYARYQYYGMTEPKDGKPKRPFNYQTVNNPFARSKWLEPYFDGEWINKMYNENLRSVRKDK